MTPYDATVHALSAVSTGGFSSYDASFATFSGPLQYSCAVFMVLASIPFVRLLQLGAGQVAPLWRDIQIRAYLRWIGYAVAAIVAWRVLGGGAPFWPTLREVTFNIVSVFSGTGFTTADLTAWGAFPLVIVLMVGMIGGCTSSTGCSLKVFRYLVLFEAIKAEVKRLHSPGRVTPLRLDGRAVEPDVVNSVMLMFSSFIIGLGLLTVGLSLTGLEFRTAVTAAWTSIFCIGPAFGPEVAPSGALGGFPDAAKTLMILGMLLGRLEMVAVLVLFTAAFWRD
jgi:trk system potassium uptake protein TrkH